MYDLREMKSILCSEVASKYGMNLKEKHGRLWGKLREEEKTSSFSINLKENLWYDFGAGKGGSVIDLVAELEGVSINEAINILAEDYGFKKEKAIGWRPLTDNQYKELGIQPEKATMNFGFDLNKHTVEQLERWSNKYGMHVRNLAEKYPTVYNKMVEKIAIENIKTIKDIYDTRVQMYHEPDTNKNTKDFLKAISKNDAEEINKRVELLQRAVTTTTINYMHLQVNFEKDFSELSQNVTQNQNVLSEDEKIRDRIVRVYKKLFKFNQAEHFTIEQAKALQDINIAISNSDNKFIPIEGIRQAYIILGKNLDKLESEYTEVLKQGQKINKVQNSKEHEDWEVNFNKIKNELIKVKDLFNKCNVVIEGLRDVNMTQINKQLKDQEIKVNHLQKNIEHSI